MVLLTMTAAMVEALGLCAMRDDKDWNSDQCDDCPSLEAPAVGKPIAHVQVIAMSRYLQEHPSIQVTHESEAEWPTSSWCLDTLLRGSKLYVEMPKPKPEPTSEYIALMARLRREEETRAYERMINPPPKTETFSQQPRIFPHAYQHKHEEDEEITYADVNRQVALIINILVSIVACSVAIWMASSHWTTPKRLGLSMGGSGMIGIAEVVVYTGYLRRLKEAKEKGLKEVEIKENIETWVIGGNDSTAEEKALEPIAIPKKPTNARPATPVEPAASVRDRQSPSASSLHPQANLAPFIAPGVAPRNPNNDMFDTSLDS